MGFHPKPRQRASPLDSPLAVVVLEASLFRACFSLHSMNLERYFYALLILCIGTYYDRYRHTTRGGTTQCHWNNDADCLARGTKFIECRKKDYANDSNASNTTKANEESRGLVLWPGLGWNPIKSVTNLLNKKNFSWSLNAQDTCEVIIRSPQA
ncbi:MAG: hypothetical protein ACI8RA_002331 [Chlamydiales bacterium]|jgi:hypothetical protein